MPPASGFGSSSLLVPLPVHFQFTSRSTSGATSSSLPVPPPIHFWCHFRVHFWFRKVPLSSPRSVGGGGEVQGVPLSSPRSSGGRSRGVPLSSPRSGVGRQVWWGVPCPVPGPVGGPMMSSTERPLPVDRQKNRKHYLLTPPCVGGNKLLSVSGCIGIHECHSGDGKLCPSWILRAG